MKDVAVSWLVRLALLLGTTNVGPGQVVLIERATSPGIGGRFGFEVLDTTAVRGDARRVGHAVKFTGTIMRHLGTRREIRIVRLDRKVFYLLDPKTRTYSAIPFTELQDRLSELRSPEKATPEAQPAESDVDHLEYDWQEPVFSSKDLQELRQVNGWKAHHWLLTVETVGTHRETGIKDTLRFEDDLWLSEAATAKLSELEDFNRRWVKVLGFEPEQGSLPFDFLKAYEKQLGDLRREAAKLKGFPVQYTFRLVATNHVAEERRKKQEAERGSGDQGNSGPPTRDLKGAFGGFLKKKALGKWKVRRQKQEREVRRDVVFEMIGDVLSIEKRALPEAGFEVPTGYRQKS